MNRYIAIIGAMDEEVRALSEIITERTSPKTPFADLPIYEGFLHNQKVIVARCGIGKVNASLATQYLIDKFAPRVIMNSGVAGGLNPAVRIGDLVIGESSLQHDFDVRKFGHPRGIIPRLAESVFRAEPALVRKAWQVAGQELPPDKVHRGLIVSGDQFISSLEQKQAILDFFPEAICAEMEGAAIAHTAILNQIPHVIVRAISDQADNTAPDDFDKYLLNIIPTLNAVIEGLVRELRG